MGNVTLMVQGISEIQGEPRAIQAGDYIVTNGKFPQMCYLGAPATATTTGIGAPIASNATSNVITISAQPAGPRNLVVAFAGSWDGGNIVIVGTDQFDGVITETITANAGNTVVGSKAFKTVTSLAKTAVGVTANAATVGMGSKLGIPVYFQGTTGIHLVTGVAEAATFDPTYHTVLAGTNLPNNSRTYVVLVNC